MAYLSLQFIYTQVVVFLASDNRIKATWYNLLLIIEVNAETEI